MTENEGRKEEREGRLKHLETVHGTSTGVQLHTHSAKVYGKKEKASEATEEALEDHMSGG